MILTILLFLLAVKSASYQPRSVKGLTEVIEEEDRDLRLMHDPSRPMPHEGRQLRKAVPP